MRFHHKPHATVHLPRRRRDRRRLPVTIPVVAAARIEGALPLNGHVVDAEALLEFGGGLPDHFIVVFGVRLDQVDGQCRLGGAHGPDVKVVHRLDAGKTGQE